MFEKEAQYYAFDEVKHKQEWYIKHPERSIDEDYEDIKKHWGKGAEFGYSKANEWHYVKDGDLPEEEKEYLVYTKKKKLEIRKIHISGDGKNYLTDVFLMRDLESVIAWKEIVLPKED